jgi:O-6-methylguanine DNA methyltransferase
MNIEERLAQLETAAPDTITEGVMLGTGLADGYAVFDSPIGDVIVAFNLNGVSALDIADSRALDRFTGRFHRKIIQAEPPRGWTDGIRRAIERGRPGTLPIDFRSVTDFQRQVLEEAARIPKGQVRPYLWLAQHVGRPNATRAVGSTMARNPVPLIVPCHRVVRSDGHIGGYSLGGPHQKRMLLEHEGINPERLEQLARRRVRFIGSDTTQIFCYPTCSNARRITANHRVEFHSGGQAADAGYRPCKVCQPA